ncbi:hypothetical protein [Aquimarina sp. AU119]|uniref:hypothetical protein n=1 Tax=Aquimarina sp. AU119 TaxID=2108528 RepID=UPI000D690166|nr:hypothetical protein [Aquimarina sp. AU119]
MELEFKGTKGKWEAVMNTSKNSWTISSWDRNKSFGHIAYINTGIGEAEDIDITANAKLIAAAPELLEALKDLYIQTLDWTNQGSIEEKYYFKSVLEKSKKAIEKTLK